MKASVVLASLGLLLAAAPAYARPEKPALHWVRGTGAQACIDPRSLARRVEDITGPAFVPAAQADVSIEARIEATADGFTLYMRLISRAAADSGERVQAFQTADCRSLDGSIAFLIAAAIDPTLGAEGVPPELSWVDDSESAANAESLRRALAQQPRPTVEPSPPSPPPPPAKDGAQDQAQGPHLWQLGLAAMGGNSADARFAMGLQLELARSITPELSIAAQLSGESALTSRELVAGRSVLSQRTAAALLACAQLPLAPAYSARGCIGPEVGAILAYGHGFDSNMTSVLGTAGVVGRIELRRELARDLTLSLGVALHSVLLRPHVYYQSADNKLEAFQATPWLLQLLIGVTYSF